jgi:hypothetical protein
MTLLPPCYDPVSTLLPPSFFQTTFRPFLALFTTLKWQQLKAIFWSSRVPEKAGFTSWFPNVLKQKSPPENSVGLYDFTDFNKL